MELTGFVGRTRLLATITQHLPAAAITVTGIGGVGKSRTAGGSRTRSLRLPTASGVDLSRLRTPGCRRR